MPTASISNIEWIHAREAGRILGISGIAIRKLGDRGRLTKREIPECRILYRRDEVERMAREAIKPAAQAK